MSTAYTDAQLSKLRQAPEQYLAQDGVEHYDEVLREVSARAKATGDLGKADIGALLFWKRLRADATWVARLHLVADAQVREVTRGARDAMRAAERTVDAARSGRSALSALPGFHVGDALASAVLLALAPDRMAIYDKRAHTALRLLGLHLDDRHGRYSRYMELVESLAEALSSSGPVWSARDVELALYELGGKRATRPVPLESTPGPPPPAASADD